MGRAGHHFQLFDSIIGRAGRPGGVSGYPRAWYIGQFREFGSPPCKLAKIRGDAFLRAN